MPASGHWKAEHCCRANRGERVLADDGRELRGEMTLPLAHVREHRETSVSCEDVVARLFEEAREDVYRYLLLLGLAPGPAQDATQEVFLRLYATMKRGQRIDNPRGWVFRVAHNHGLTVRGREGALRPMEEEKVLSLPDGATGPEQDLIEREQRLTIARAVESLSPQQRQCLHLRSEGFRYREIASILGISDSTVAEFLKRAITRLRKALHA